jgi:hypothetical protein
MELQLRGTDVQRELEWLRDAMRESYGPLGRYAMLSIALVLLVVSYYNLPGHPPAHGTGILFMQVVSFVPIPRS